MYIYIIHTYAPIPTYTAQVDSGDFGFACIAVNFASLHRAEE